MSLAAKSVSGKILAIFFPIMAFVAMGFDHVVANMFFLPAAICAGVPDLGWGDALLNWLFAGVGNLVGAVVFVATSYWYLFLKDQPEQRPRRAGAGRARLSDSPRIRSAACVRSRTCILVSTWETWFCTVFRLSPSSRAISGLLARRRPARAPRASRAVRSERVPATRTAAAAPAAPPRRPNTAPPAAHRRSPTATSSWAAPLST